VASFSAAASNTPPSGGIWGAGGPAIDGDGRVWATTGNSPDGSADTPGMWGQTLLRWHAPLELDGTYTPFNYCALDIADADLGGDTPTLFDADGAATPHLVAFGCKQGDVYLVDRDHLPGRLDRRPPCSSDAASDGSLLAPSPQPQFGTRGPLDVFGPYSEVLGNLDTAKMRSTPARMRDANGWALFVSGATKAKADPSDLPESSRSVPPCVVKLRVVAAPDAPAWLAVEATEPSAVFINPGSPVVSSDGARNAVVWILDENAPRVASLLSPGTPHPVLYAFEGATLRLLWKSAAGELELGGKYSTPLVVGGVVVVGTDRLRAFGLR
jgi:hypothetical protein